MCGAIWAIDTYFFKSGPFVEGLQSAIINQNSHLKPLFFWFFSMWVTVQKFSDFNTQSLHNRTKNEMENQKYSCTQILKFPMFCSSVRALYCNRSTNVQSIDGVQNTPSWVWYKAIIFWPGIVKILLKKTCSFLPKDVYSCSALSYWVCTRTTPNLFSWLSSSKHIVGTIKRFNYVI